MAVSESQPSVTIDDSDLLVNEGAFNAAYGEPLNETLDINTWSIGGDLEGLYQRLEAEVGQAVQTENELRKTIRSTILPRIATRSQSPRGGGWYKVKPDDLKRIHTSLLFNGAVEACDGTSVEYDTLPITITQIGVCTVSYQGDQGSWTQRLYRRDLRASTGNALDDVLALLDNRSRRGSTDTDERSKLSELAKRGIMTYAERAILAQKCQAPWRMGHGNPIPYELLTGSGSMDLLDRSMDILRELILQHRKIVFVPSAPSDRRLLTLGHAMNALEFIIFQTVEESLLQIVGGGHYSKQYRRKAEEFSREIGPNVVLGMYKASAAAPVNFFYSHIDHACEAALIAMADSVLQEHRGFPMLIDLADTICRTTFGNDIFNSAVQMAYASVGEPYRFLTERQTRV